MAHSPTHDSSNLLNSPGSPIPSRPPISTNMALSAPEIVALIDRGVLDAQGNVSPGWIDRYSKGKRQFIKAFTYADLVYGYRKDPDRVVHTLDIADNTVLDTQTMARLKTELETETFKAFQGEWEYMVHLIFEDIYNAPNVQ